MGSWVWSIFPPHGLDQTIHVSILLGVWFLLLLTEAFGWVYSGLVVPGYLASVLVFQPAAGLAILAEALLTFLVARFLSDVVSRSGAWSKFFGRERFVLLILVSVIVRQSSELWLLPDTLRLVDQAFGTTFHLSRQVSSIGLVLVPLTANMFWKLDVRRGLLQVLVPTLATWALLTYFFIPHTNLSFSRLELTYENVALDFLSSPKAYIVLVVGAYVASRYNLMFGWDYSGILVPALLAIACFSPLRLVTTAAEATVLVGAVRAVTLLPGLRTMNLEGPRKVALVFTLSFVLKYLLGWLAGPWLGDLKVTDLFGFGYLVPSLIAVKMLQKEAVGRILVPAFAVGLLAFVVGSGVGFGLDQLAPPAEAAPRASSEPLVTTRALLASPVGAMALAHVRTRQGVSGDVPLTRPWRELERYTVLWRAIDAWLAHDTPAAQAQVTRLARQSGLDLRPLGTPVGGRLAYALVEAEERLGDEVGWDTAVLVPGAKGPVIEAPRPASEAPAAEAAAVLCEQVRCRAVLASGVDTHEAGLSAGDALAEARAPFAIAHRQLRSAHVLQVRADATIARGKALLHVDERLPDLDLDSLWPALELSWQPPPGTNLEYEGGATAVLRVHPDDLWLLIAAHAPALPAAEPGVALESFLTRSYGRGDAETPAQAAAADGTYTPPSQSELRFLETLVAAPLLGVGDAGHLPAYARRCLAHHFATLVGYELRQLPDGAGPGVGTWLLAEKARPARLGWGVIAGREGAAQPVAVEVPRPRLEGGTWRLGTELWLASGAELLLVAGEPTALVADEDPADDADPASGWNLVTPFQALHQAAHAHLATQVAPMILQVRGFAATQPVREPLVITLGRPLLDAADAPRRLGAALAEPGALGFLHGAARYYDGSLAMLELAGSGNAQLHYSTRLGTVACALLWFSERVRAPYREADPARERARFAPFGLPLAETPAAVALTTPALGAPPALASRALAARYQALLAIAQAYAAQENVQILRRLREATSATAGAFVHAGFSAELGRPYLLVEVHEGAEVLRGLVLVPGGDFGDRGLDAGGADLPLRVAEAIFQRPRSITVHGAQVER